MHPELKLTVWLPASRTKSSIYTLFPNELFWEIRPDIFDPNHPRIWSPENCRYPNRPKYPWRGVAVIRIIQKSKNFDRIQCIKWIILGNQTHSKIWVYETADIRIIQKSGVRIQDAWKELYLNRLIICRAPIGSNKYFHPSRVSNSYHTCVGSIKQWSIQRLAPTSHCIGQKHSNCVMISRRRRMHGASQKGIE